MGAVYILINCAGTAICGTLENLSIKDAQVSKVLYLR